LCWQLVSEFWWAVVTTDDGSENSKQFTRDVWKCIRALSGDAAQSEAFWDVVDTAAATSVAAATGDPQVAIDLARDLWCKYLPPVRIGLYGGEAHLFLLVLGLTGGFDVGFTTHLQAYGSGYAGGGFALGLGLNVLQGASVGYGETQGGFSADGGYIGFASYGYGWAAGGTVQMSAFEPDAGVSIQQRIRGGAGGGVGMGAGAGIALTGTAATPSVCASR
jgi:hypothetical protein